MLLILKKSESEKRFISILPHKLRKCHDSADLEFLNSLDIINIQKANYESMSAGLFSVNEEILSDKDELRVISTKRTMLILREFKSFLFSLSKPYS